MYKSQVLHQKTECKMNANKSAKIILLQLNIFKCIMHLYINCYTRVIELEGFPLMCKFMRSFTACMPVLLQSAVHASGYSDGLSGDVRGFVWAQERNHATYILWLPESKRSRHNVRIRLPETYKSSGKGRVTAASLQVLQVMGIFLKTFIMQS